MFPCTNLDKYGNTIGEVCDNSEALRVIKDDCGRPIITRALAEKLLAARARIAELEESVSRYEGIDETHHNLMQHERFARFAAEEELAALRAKLAEFEPRPITCDDEWLTARGSVARFHDYPTVESARMGMTTAVCRLVRIPIVPRAAEPPEPRAHAGEAEKGEDDDDEEGEDIDEMRLQPRVYTFLDVSGVKPLRAALRRIAAESDDKHARKLALDALLGDGGGL